jgi:hypothetical protein
VRVAIPTVVFAVFAAVATVGVATPGVATATGGAAAVQAPAAHPVAPVTQSISVPTAGVAATERGAFAPAGRVLVETAELGTAAFRMVGVSWDHDSRLTDLTGEIRVRDDGQWSGWQQVASDADNSAQSGPDGVAARDGADPIWVDHADGVQLRLTSVTGDAPVGLRLDLIDPGTSAADAAVTSGTSGVERAAALTAADAAQPTILPRSAWGADESLRERACPGGPIYTGTPKVAFLHHTVTGNGYAASAVPAIIRSIYAFHVESEGWCDVGYNYLVDAYGRIWEGRAGGINTNVLGAQAGGFNTDSFGVALIGTFTSARPDAAMMNSAAAVMAWKLAASYDNPIGKATLTAAPFDGARYAPGTNVELNVISGHRDVDSTDCPGSGAYALLPALRVQVLRDIGAGLVSPGALMTSPRTLAGNGVVQVESGLIAPGSWQLAISNAAGEVVRTISGAGSGVDTLWDMTDDSGAPVPAGAYTLTLSSTQNGATAKPWSTTETVGGVFGAVNTAKGSLSGTAGQVEVVGWAASPTSTDAAPVQVSIDGTVVASASTSVSRPDVTARYPSYTAATGFDLTEPAKPGYHTVCVLGDDSALGISNTTLGCLGATVPGLVSGHAVPRGSLDLVRAGAGSVTVGGWTFDADTTAPILVHVYVDSVFRGAFTADGDRPDVAAIYPSEGADHGFGATVSGLLGGVHTVCVFGINVGGGSSNTLLGCTRYTAVGGNPRGSLNAARGVPGGIVVSGWALDPDTTAGPTVDLYVDGRFAERTTANLPRADVSAAFPGYGATHGFTVTVPVGSGGRHQVCAYAINRGLGSTNPRLGCATIATPTGKPLGSLDSAVGQQGGAALAGWSIDPDTTAPVTIHVYVDGRFAIEFSADIPRADVGNAFPGYGDAHSFDTVVAMKPGRHDVCVYAINVGPAAVNPQLGCRELTTS